MTLRFTPPDRTEDGPEGRFTPENLSIELTVDGKVVTWHPGDTDPENLQGTTRTLDGALGSKTRSPSNRVWFPAPAGRWWTTPPGRSSIRLISASSRAKRAHGRGSSNGPPASGRTWYFFGYGHDYRKALGDYVRVAGRIPLPPRFAFGAWWSRYWDYSDQETRRNGARLPRELDVPLDVLVIDMGWHISARAAQGCRRSGSVRTTVGLGRLHLGQAALSRPRTISSTSMHNDGLKTTLNLHPASGIQPWEAGVSRDGQGHGHRSMRRENMCPSTSPTRSSLSIT